VVERQTVLHQACDQVGRVPIPTRMSFRVELSTITGDAPSAGGKRPIGHGAPLKSPATCQATAKQRVSMPSRSTSTATATLDQLLQSMECFMQDVAPIVSGERIGSKS
jgi:hypothetical protein